MRLSVEEICCLLPSLRASSCFLHHVFHCTPFCRALKRFVHKESLTPGKSSVSDFSLNHSDSCEDRRSKVLEIVCLFVSKEPGH